MYSKNLLKGTLKPIILNLLEDMGEMYGYEITQTVKERTKNEISLTEGALYPALHKLEAQGLLDTYMKVYNGRNRKYYVLTDKGLRESKLAREGWLHFSKLVNQIIKPFSHA